MFHDVEDEVEHAVEFGARIDLQEAVSDLGVDSELENIPPAAGIKNDLVLNLLLPTVRVIATEIRWAILTRRFFSIELRRCPTLVMIARHKSSYW